MKTFEIRHTVTPRGEAFFVNGKQRTKKFVELLKAGAREDSFFTRIIGDRIQNFSIIHVAPPAPKTFLSHMRILSPCLLTAAGLKEKFTFASVVFPSVKPDFEKIQRVESGRKQNF